MGPSSERDIDRRPPREVVASLRDSVAGGVVLVGPGQFSPHAEHERVGILRVDVAGEPLLVWDRFFLESQLAELRAALREVCSAVFEGEFDTMYATGWVFAWTVRPAPFRLFDRRGAIAVEEGGALRLHLSEGTREIAFSDIDNIAGWVAPDWIARGVAIVVRGGERIILAEVYEPFVKIDPTYDGLDLWLDASWAAQLGKAMAASLGVPYVAEDSALR